MITIYFFFKLKKTNLKKGIFKNCLPLILNAYANDTQMSLKTIQNLPVPLCTCSKALIKRSKYL